MGRGRKGERASVAAARSIHGAAVALCSVLCRARSPTQQGQGPASAWADVSSMARKGILWPRFRWSPALACRFIWSSIRRRRREGVPERKLGPKRPKFPPRAGNEQSIGPSGLRRVLPIASGICCRQREQMKTIAAVQGKEKRTERGLTDEKLLAAAGTRTDAAGIACSCSLRVGARFQPLP